MKKFKKNPIQEAFHVVWRWISVFFKTAWTILKDIFEILFQFIRTLFSVWMQITIGIGILLTTSVLSIFLLSESIGLSESKPFQEYRDSVLTTYFQYIPVQQSMEEYTSQKCTRNSDCFLPLSLRMEDYYGKCVEQQCALIRYNFE